MDSQPLTVSATSGFCITVQRLGVLIVWEARIQCYLFFVTSIKKQRHYFANKGPSSQDYSFSSGHVWMWELNYKESWVLKNWCFWAVVLEKTLESPLDCKEIQWVHPKGDEPWDFFGRNDAKAESPVLWPPDAKNWLLGKDPDAGKEWRQEEKGTTKDEMVRWYHQINGDEWASSRK